MKLNKQGCARSELAIALLASLIGLGLVGCSDDVPGYYTPSEKCQACGEKQVCIAETCLDKCGDAVCSAEQTCVSGVCKDKEKCGDAYCESTQTCVEGACKEKCGDAVCNDNQMCVDGACKEKCGDIVCNGDQICVGNACMDTECGDLTCISGMVCYENVCVDPLCIGVECEDGEICVAGQCKTDDLCARVQCENGRVCQPATGQCRYEGDIKVEATVTKSETNPTTNKPQTTEDGKTTATVSIVLDHAPEGTVTVSCAVDPATEATADCSGITFDETNWNIPQTVVISGVPDGAVDGDKDYTVTITTHSETDAQFDGLERVLDFTSVDTDTAEISVSSDVYKTDETGASATVPVSLTSKPTAPVTITVTSDDVTEGVLIGADGAPAGSITLTFTPDNWNVPQNVTVKGQSDEIADGTQNYTVSMTAASEDANFDGKTAQIHLANKDNTPGISVVPADSKKLEEGGAKIYEISLNTEPTSDVAVNVSNEGFGSNVTVCLVDANGDIAKDADGNDKCAASQSITISKEDYEAGVRIAVKADKDNTINDTLRTFEVSVTVDAANTADTGYAAVVGPKINGEIADKDTAGVTIETPAETVVSEDGAKTMTVTVTLPSKPKADVTVAINIGDEGEVKVSEINGAAPAGTPTLTFAPDNWNVPQTVTFTGVPDDVIDGNQTSSVDFVPSSADAHFNYDAASNAGVKTTVSGIVTEDCDKAEFVLTGVDPVPSVGENDPAGKDYTFTLSAKPENPVKVTIKTDSDRAAATFGPGVTVTDNGDGSYSVTIAPEDWDKPVTVHVAGKDNDYKDGDKDVAISMEISSEDANFDGKTASATVKIIDDDTASIVLPETVTFDLTDSETINVKLSSAPQQDTTVTFTDSASGKEYTVEFKAGEDTWKTGQSIEIKSDSKQADNYNATLEAEVTTSGDDYKDITNEAKIVVVRSKEFKSNSCAVHEQKLKPGKYRLQVWGAAGGDLVGNDQTKGSHGGLGGYAVGTLTVTDDVTVYVTAGGLGRKTVNSSSGGVDTSSAGCNGGGAGCGVSGYSGYGGGGASDMRIGDKTSLYARIIVAGGGGGADNSGDEDDKKDGSVDPANNGSGGYGGGETGGEPLCGNAECKGVTAGATQTSGHEFGKGQACSAKYDAGGAGGGWYGGKAHVDTTLTQSNNKNMGGGGGSGFVYTAASAASVPAGYAVDAKYQLTDAKTIAGNASMPQQENYLDVNSTDPAKTMTGNTGDGYARITRIVE